MDERPVGLFDSGVGGLSVAHHLRQLAPEEDLLYFADTAYFPYGPRPAAEVRKRCFAVTHRLIKSNVKLIVVACNTASAAALADLREMFPVPFVGMVPGLKPATSRSRSGVVAILATSGTLDGDLYSRVHEEFGRTTKVMNIVAHGLAERVEAGDTGSPQLREMLRDYLEPAMHAGADTVVLGCTHFHFLGSAIEEECPGLQVIDTAEPVARRAIEVLQELDVRAPPDRLGGLSIIVSGDRARFWGTMGRLGFLPAGANV